MYIQRDGTWPELALNLQKHGAVELILTDQSYSTSMERNIPKRIAMHSDLYSDLIKVRKGVQGSDNVSYIIMYGNGFKTNEEAVAMLRKTEV